MRSAPDAISILRDLRAHNLGPLLEQVCQRRGVLVLDLCGRARSLSVNRARQELWSLIRSDPERCYSLPELARLFARDHTTIGHGIAAHMRRSGP